VGQRGGAKITGGSHSSDMQEGNLWEEKTGSPKKSLYIKRNASRIQTVQLIRGGNFGPGVLVWTEGGGAYQGIVMKDQ